MASIAEVTAPADEKTITIAGQQYPANTFNMPTIGRMQGVVDKIPDPKPWKEEYENLKLARDAGIITEEQCRTRAEEAFKDSAAWPPQILGDARANKYLFYNVDVMKAAVAGSLRVSIEKATELLENVDFPLYEKILNIGFNSPDDEGQADPKAHPAADGPVV